jgi:hypothetical protein
MTAQQTTTRQERGKAIAMAEKNQITRIDSTKNASYSTKA